MIILTLNSTTLFTNPNCLWISATNLLFFSDFSKKSVIKTFFIYYLFLSFKTHIPTMHLISKSSRDLFSMI